MPKQLTAMVAISMDWFATSAMGKAEAVVCCGLRVWGGVEGRDA
jgi:hypothetical protein